MKKSLILLVTNILLLGQVFSDNLIEVEIIQTGRGDEEILLYGIQDEQKQEENVNDHNQTKPFFILGNNFWSPYFLRTQIISDETIKVSKFISHFNLSSSHAHGVSSIKKYQGTSKISMSKQFIKSWLKLCFDVDYTSNNPKVFKSSSGTFNVTPISATVENLSKPFSPQTQLFDFNQETGFSSPTISLQLDSIKLDFRDIHAQLIASYKPSIGSVDSGNDDFLLGMFLKGQTKNHLCGLYISYSWIGDFKNITPSTSYIRTKNVVSTALHYSKAFESYAFSASLEVQQNPMRTIDDSALFGEIISSFNLGVKRRFDNYSLSSTVGIGISGAVPDISIGIGLSY